MANTVALPAISVIIPNYNHARFLKERIDSVLNQTFQDFEIIILDDCSTDNSREIIDSYREHPKVSVVDYNTTNSGSPFRQWKKGLQLAKGDYVWIAESDDVAAPEFLFLLIKAFNNPYIVLAYCQSVDIDEKGSILANRIAWTEEFDDNIWAKDFTMKGPDFAGFLKIKNVIPNVSACLMKRNGILELISIDKELETFKFAGDWYLWMNLSRLPGAQIAFVSQALNFFRVSSTSTRHFPDLKKKERRILEELRIVNNNTDLFRESELAARYTNLKQKWFSVHNKFSILRKSFYEIGNVIGTGRMQLLSEFVKYKWKRK